MRPPTTDLAVNEKDACTSRSLSETTACVRDVYAAISGDACLQLTERRLDRLRTIKSRMVRLNTRVETVRSRVPVGCTMLPTSSRS
jgi:hypothetical protein